MSPSLFTSTFRLTPWHFCLHLNFHNKELSPGFVAVCVRDALAISWVGEPERNEAARGVSRSLARSLVQAHAYYSFPNGPLLEVEPVTWLEIRNCEAKETVLGYMHPSLTAAPLQRGHEDNTAMLHAADLVRALTSLFSLQLAITDFYAARRELGPYSAFYAYRVLEDVGFSFGAKGDHPDWDAMNTALKTNKDKWQPLTDAGTRARHLSQEKLEKLAGMDQQKLLALSHEALTLALVCSGSGNVSPSDSAS